MMALGKKTGPPAHVLQPTTHCVRPKGTLSSSCTKQKYRIPLINCHGGQALVKKLINQCLSVIQIIIEFYLALIDISYGSTKSKP